jgi:hypothetical protein
VAVSVSSGDVPVGGVDASCGVGRDIAASRECRELESPGVRLAVVDLSVHFREDLHRYQAAGVHMVLLYRVGGWTPTVIEHQLQEYAGVEISCGIGFVGSRDRAIGHGIAASD